MPQDTPRNAPSSNCLDMDKGNRDNKWEHAAARVFSSSSGSDMSEYFHRLYQYIMGVTSTNYEAIAAEDVPDGSALDNNALYHIRKGAGRYLHLRATVSPSPMALRPNTTGNCGRYVPRCNQHKTHSSSVSTKPAFSLLPLLFRLVRTEY